MDLNKKLVDQLSDLSRNIKSLTSEVKGNREDISNQQKESFKSESENKEIPKEKESNLLKSLEGIFKKGVTDMVKSNKESNGILKDAIVSNKEKGIESIKSPSFLPKDLLKGVTPEIPLKGINDINSIIKKLPKFESGGKVDKNLLALVGEKGPELVKLNKGSEVIPSDKTKEAMSSMKTMDQTILEKKGPTVEQIEKYKNHLEKDEFYKSYPDRLKEDVETWKRTNKERSSLEIDNMMKGYWETQDSLKKETPDKLSEPPKKTLENLSPEPLEEMSKKEKRKKEREEKKNKKLEDLQNLKDKEKNIPGEVEKKENVLKKKGIEKGKNFLLSKGKDILSGKTSIQDIMKNPSSLLPSKEGLLKEGKSSAFSFLTDKNTGKLGIKKIKDLKRKKEEEKSSISTESPELKKIQKKEEKKEEIKEELQPKKPEPLKEIPKKEKIEEKKESETKTEISKSSSKDKENSVKVSDLDDIKGLLAKIASLLEGPLSIESSEIPFRPDSRRF
jgi:hypothetical protein